LAEEVQDKGYLPPLVERLGASQTLLQEMAGLLVLTEQMAKGPTPGQHPHQHRAGRFACFWRLLQIVPGPGKYLLPFLIAALGLVEMIERFDRPVERVQMILLRRPLPGQPHILDILADLVQQRPLCLADEQRRPHPEKVEVIGAMAVLGGPFLMRVCGQLLVGKLAQQLMHLIAAARRHPYHRLLDQGGQGQQRSAGHLQRGLMDKPAPEERQPLEHRPFSLVQQLLPRLLQDGVHTAMAGRDVLVASGEDVQAALDLVGDLLAGKRLQPRRRQLQRQRRPPHQPADARYMLPLYLQVEIGAGAAGA